MRASVIGCVSTSLPCGFDGSSGGSPSAMRFAFGPSIWRICASVNPAARAVRSAISSDAGCCPYG